jgi:NADPH:quinone reductase-like Zn-dependent oxidoreductase
VGSPRLTSACCQTARSSSGQRAFGLGGHCNADAGTRASGRGAAAGGLLVALAVLRGAQVIATASRASWQRVTALGPGHVIDCHDQDWPEHVRALTGHHGVAAALRAVADGGRLATITSDPPASQRRITVVRADGYQLDDLAQQLGNGKLDESQNSKWRFAHMTAPLIRCVALSKW